MAKVRSIQDVVRRRLCVSCGACVSQTPPGTMRMVLRGRRNLYVPEILDPEQVSGRGGEFDVCPGPGYPIDRISRELYGRELPTSPELGRYRLAVAAHATDRSVLRRASSGGVMTEIALYLLETGRIDGGTIVDLEYGRPGPRPIARIARSEEEMLAGQGSKYCPTSTNVLVRQCLESGGRYLFCGLPCQVGALRLAAGRNPKLGEVFPYTMANFCGGFRDFRFLDWLISKHGLDPAEVRYFRFRGDGQPGSMCARTADGREVKEPYPEYNQGCVIPKYKRCVFCIDGTGLLADFACGDAWLERYGQDDFPWSIILCRSEQAVRTIRELVEAGRLTTEDISAEDIIESQWTNLSSKIDRQHKRMRFCGLLGMAMPSWDVQLPRHRSSYPAELRTLILKHLARYKVLRWLKRKLKGR